MGMTITKQVKLSYSANDWELYTVSHSVEAEAAAWEINAAIEKAVNAGMTEMEVLEAVDPVFLKHADLGAMDSEPLYKLEKILYRIFRKD